MSNRGRVLCVCEYNYFGGSFLSQKENLNKDGFPSQLGNGQSSTRYVKDAVT